MWRNFVNLRGRIAGYQLAHGPYLTTGRLTRCAKNAELAGRCRRATRVRPEKVRQLPIVFASWIRNPRACLSPAIQSLAASQRNTRHLLVAAVKRFGRRQSHLRASSERIIGIEGVGEEPGLKSWPNYGKSRVDHSRGPGIFISSQRID